MDDTICGGSGPLFSEALLKLRHRLSFRTWQVGERMFCGSKYVQNKATKEIMITQTEFAAKIIKIPMSAARKKMREYLADKAEIHAFRGVSGSVSWLAGQTRLDVSCHVSQLQLTLPQPIVAQVCASSMVVRRVHQHLDLGFKIRRVPVQNMILLLHGDASLNTGGLVGSQGGYICGVSDQSLLDVKSAPWSPLAWRTLKNKSHSAELIGCGSTSNVCGPGIRRMGNAVFEGADSRFVRFACAPAVMQERPLVCVSDCKSLYDHSLPVGSPTTLKDKRSAVDVRGTKRTCLLVRAASVTGRYSAAQPSVLCLCENIASSFCFLSIHGVWPFSSNSLIIDRSWNDIGRYY